MTLTVSKGSSQSLHWCHHKPGSALGIEQNPFICPAGSHDVIRFQRGFVTIPTFVLLAGALNLALT